jgi:hypothetical protein
MTIWDLFRGSLVLLLGKIFRHRGNLVVGVTLGDLMHYRCGPRAGLEVVHLPNEIIPIETGKIGHPARTTAVRSVASHAIRGEAAGLEIRWGLLIWRGTGKHSF